MNGRVDADFQEDFLSFVNTGEATEAFLRYAEQSRPCQEAIDLAAEQMTCELAEAANEIGPVDSHDLKEKRVTVQQHSLPVEAG